MKFLATTNCRQQIRVTGIVQGVGFRPFVWSLAHRLELSGFVSNSPAGVIIEIEGDPPALEAFLAELRDNPPSLSEIDSISVAALNPINSKGFEIMESERAGAASALISPDVATCEDCLAEMADPSDRRFRYPFINCTSCGPRFTIVQGIPYDRAYTTMSSFALCEDCRTEYEDPADRRFHAQPVCCGSCGPALKLFLSTGEEAVGDPVERTAEILQRGGIVAIKGLGGYHLATAADNEAAVSRLRANKHRELRPFAVMVPDLAAAQTLCWVSPAEAALLTSAARPIVIMSRRDECVLATSVSPMTANTGVMLPYTPLHHLLMSEYGKALVMTSGNISDEPIAFTDHDARERLIRIADAFLMHDRTIETRVDDSVVRVMAGRTQPIRRSRGYVPAPLRLPFAAPRHVLACGSQLKNTFCLAREDRAFISHHIGDLDNFETLKSFTTGIEHFKRLFEITPAVVVHDLHPEYLSTKYALELDDIETLGVQHHHAHIASCMADNVRSGPVIGVAFDGVGYGPDGTSWGGEFLVADLQGFDRFAHLTPMPMPGGDAAVHAPWRMALSYLDAVWSELLPADLAIQIRNVDRWAAVRSVMRAGINSPTTSSAGRLFDAVAAIIGVRDEVSYEGQAAIELEQLADPMETVSYPFASACQDQIETRGLVRAVVEDLQSGTPVATISARFHNSVAVMIADTCALARDVHGLETVALSGGVFQNALLLDRTIHALEAQRFTVLTHHQVPTNDGGISFGQAAIAAARSGSR